MILDITAKAGRWKLGRRRGWIERFGLANHDGAGFRNNRGTNALLTNGRSPLLTDGCAGALLPDRGGILTANRWSEGLGRNRRAG